MHGALDSGLPDAAVAASARSGGRRRSPTVGNWAILGPILGALLLVPFLAVAGFMLWLFAGPDIDHPRSAVDRFVRHLERNEDRAAYQSMCSKVRDRITVAQFTEGVELLGRPVSHALGHAAFDDEAGNSASMTVRLTDHSGRTTPVDLHLKNDEGWRVCDDAFG